MRQDSHRLQLAAADDRACAEQVPSSTDAVGGDAEPPDGSGGSGRADRLASGRRLWQAPR